MSSNRTKRKKRKPAGKTKPPQGKSNGLTIVGCVAVEFVGKIPPALEAMLRVVLPVVVGMTIRKYEQIRAECQCPACVASRQAIKDGTLHAAFAVPGGGALEEALERARRKVNPSGKPTPVPLQPQSQTKRRGGMSNRTCR